MTTASIALKCVEDLAAKKYIHSLPLFESLSPEDRDLIEACSDVIRVKSGAVLFREGEPATCFFLVAHGRVKVRRISSSGHEVILHVAERPRMIGCKGLTKPDTVYPADGVALEESVVLRLCHGRFMKVLGQNPDVIFRLLMDLNSRLSEIFTIQGTLMQPLEQRIATLLLHQALPMDAQLDEWERHPLHEVRLTKATIASIVGTTTETTIRIISRWRQKGYVTCGRGRVRLEDPSALYDIAMGENG